VRLWDLGTGKEKANLRNAPGGESVVAFSHDGRTLAAASFRQQANPVSVTLWALDGPAPREVARLPTSQQLYPRRLIFFPGDRRLALLDMYGVVMIWDLVSGQLPHEWNIAPGPQDLVVAEDGRHLALVNGNGTVSILRVPAPSAAPIPFQPLTLVGQPAPIPDVKSWTIQQKTAIGQDPPCSLRAAQAAWSPDGRRVAFSDDIQNRLLVWDLVRGELVVTRPASFFSWQPLAWSPDGKILAQPQDDQVLLLETAGFTLDGKLPVKAVRAVAFLPEGKLVTAAGTRVQVWDTTTHQAGQSIDHPSDVARLEPAPDGGRVFVVGSDRQGVLYALEDGRPLGPARFGMQVECPPAWSADGKWLAAAMRHNLWDFLAVWDGRTGQPVGQRLVSEGVRAIGWSPSGEELTCWLARGDLRRLHRQRSGSYLVGSLPPVPLSDRGSGRFLPGGRLLATNSNHELYLWDAATGQPRGALVALPQGQWLAVSDEGHYRGSPGIEKEIVYVVQPEAGPQKVLTPAEFAKKYGWKNDPEKVKLAGN
jgi:WD40 repeat protein